ncbi:MAG: glycerol-3-phosphate 1-O-acyltransferase PlsY [Oscillospiraceae bacterium]|jgi:glycerol-3-phosphate acyltransferase PlsY|nr:glycerol-3-phosphate 1-O-acyltransferase PlsY [Oscillospiraceae bacterium]
MFAISVVLMIVVPYFICGINFSIIITKLKSGQDIRKLGSGNPGLTNVLRTQGKTAALIVVLLDLAKGYTAVTLVRVLFEQIADTGPLAGSDHGYLLYIAALCGVIGSVFPIYYGFKGGKGVMSTASTLCAVKPLTVLILIGLFAVIVAITRYVSLGSMIAGTLLTPAVFVASYAAGEPSALMNAVFTAGISILLVTSHRANITRLKNHTEKRFGVKE